MTTHDGFFVAEHWWQRGILLLLFLIVNSVACLFIIPVSIAALFSQIGKKPVPK